jgi:hypothetical protein
MDHLYLSGAKKSESQEFFHHAAELLWLIHIGKMLSIFGNYF